MHAYVLYLSYMYMYKPPHIGNHGNKDNKDLFPYFYKVRELRSCYHIRIKQITYTRIAYHIRIYIYIS